MSATAFYEPLGADRYRATEHTVGPWDGAAQHGGPPSALLARALENESPSAPPGTVVRLSVDLLGPVPVGEVTVRSRVLRPGRRIELVEAELEADGRTVVRAQGWRIRAAGLDLPPLPPVDDAVPPFPAEGVHTWPWSGGYLDSMQWRRTEQPGGPAVIWARMRHALVEGEEPTGLQRMLVVADTGSGVSAVLDPREWLFINPELTVHVAALPTGEWIGLDARSHIDERGFGMANSRIFDRDRLVGVGAQALFVGPRDN